MPVMGGFAAGAVRGFGRGMGGAVTPITFRSVANAGQSSGTLAAKPAGIAVGDLVIVFTHYDDGNRSLAATGGTTWNKIGPEPANVHGYPYSLWWKILDSTDVANAWNFSSSLSYASTSIAYIANGATTVTKKFFLNNGTGQTSLVLTGFTKSATCRGIITYIGDRDASTSVGTPSGFTLRHGQVVGTYWYDGVADIDPASYVNGTNVTWTGTAIGNQYAESGWLLEVT